MNSPNKHGAILSFPDGSVAFVDGIPDTCKHDYSDPVYQTASGKWIFWYTYRKWAHLTSKDRGMLIQELHFHNGDPILLGTSQCTKCKKIYEPNFFTEEF